MGAPTDINSGLTVDRLNELFHIDAEAGSMIWTNPPLRHQDLRGKEAGTKNVHGYVQVGIDGHMYRRARLIWFYANGRWPAEHMDHRNLEKSDDRISNLREATTCQNHQNARILRNNTSGKKGVDWSASKRKWRCRITVDRRVIHLGYFSSLDECIHARVIAEQKYHGDFARAA